MIHDSLKQNTIDSSSIIVGVIEDILRRGHLTLQGLAGGGSSGVPLCHGWPVDDGSGANPSGGRPWDVCYSL